MAGMENHGHVIPRADATKADCGGPGLCDDCTFASFSPKTAALMYETWEREHANDERSEAAQ